MMKANLQLTIKPSLLNDLIALPQREAKQINTRIAQLTQDPTPDGKTKKHLKYLHGKFYRLRSGDYRIIYTYNEHSLGVVAIRRRKEDTYDDDTLDDDLLGELDTDLDPFQEEEALKSSTPVWEYTIAKKEVKRLPEPITLELLEQLRVPSCYHKRLLPLTTEDELLACPGVDEEMLLRIEQYMFELPLETILAQPDLIVQDVDDLLRYKEGELLPFLLKLSPEQEKYVRWSLNTSGPTLVKGGPGTGKSTVALYRVRSLLEQLRSQGGVRILYTTYTNALVKSSEQLLELLLGDDARSVKVRTADKLVYEVLNACGQVKDILDNDDLYRLTRQAISEVKPEGNEFQQAVQKQTLERLGWEYLLQEITTIIVARQITEKQAYFATSRAGRKVRFNQMQRTLVWNIYTRWCELLQATGKETWQQRRARAETLVHECQLYQLYDAVVIDEAQDLDPSILRMLLALCKAPNCLFVTADANQSIYGSGFSWNDVHHDLKFQGRTSILRANYRSTREIGEAARSYLDDSSLEPEEVAATYVNDGLLPDVRTVTSSANEVQLLGSYIRKASSNLRLTIGSCAILCPSERAGQRIAHLLHEQGIEATFMSGQNLDLKHSGVKILTLNSSKGLEFPIVALAGFIGGTYPVLPNGINEDERAEIFAKERRTMYVGMTRAMRTLLVAIPDNTHNALFQGFDVERWNTSLKS